MWAKFSFFVPVCVVQITWFCRSNSMLWSTSSSCACHLLFTLPIAIVSYLDFPSEQCCIWGLWLGCGLLSFVMGWFVQRWVSDSKKLADFDWKCLANMSSLGSPVGKRSLIWLDIFFLCYSQLHAMWDSLFMTTDTEIHIKVVLAATLIPNTI